MDNQLAKAYPKQVRNLADGPVLIRVDDRDADDTFPGFCGIHLLERLARAISKGT